MNTHGLPHLLLVAISLMGAVVVFTWRVRETTRPVTLTRIILPPLGMGTGFGMFVYPPTRIPLAWAAAAFLLGALVFAYPLMRSSKLVTTQGVVTMQRSRAFLVILLGLVTIRVAARSYVETWVSPLQTGAIFFVLAFGMILRWRVSMAFHYARLVASSPPGQPPAQ